tara:strand:- start:989 stop:3607 length:2619 start_codon:yes stop_codon:yes gene_type:complete
MKYIEFGSKKEYHTAILIKEKALKDIPIRQSYLEPLEAEHGISDDGFIAFSLEYTETNKAPVNKVIKPYLSDLLPVLASMDIKRLFCCDANYFKVLTGAKKVEAKYGYSVPCCIKGFEYMEIIFAPNYQALFHNPNFQPKLDLSIHKLAASITGAPMLLGNNIIHSKEYVKDYADIKRVLLSLLDKEKLTCDIETFSLETHKAGLGTISFSWDKHNGVTIYCDYKALEKQTPEGFFAQQIDNQPVKRLLREFFEYYEGKMIYQNGNFDMKILTYELFMDEYLDREGMLYGIDVLTKNFDDTKLLAYLATNSTTGNELSLKQLAHEFAGDYAEEDIKDIRLIPPTQLAEYNLVDALSTFYVYDKHRHKVIQDKQDIPYTQIFHPSVKVILQMELTGMPICIKRTHEVHNYLSDIKDKTVASIINHPDVQDFLYQKRLDAYNNQHLRWVKKRVPFSYFEDDIQFNPNSNTQLQELIYTFLGYAPVDFTKAKQPSTKADTLVKLMAAPLQPRHSDLFRLLLDLAEVQILVSTFTSTFLEKAVQKSDGHYYLHGNFNLGGTVSGRLSSSGPNLQNIPSTGNKYAKLIKSCFMAPPGWIFAGADFSSLEDRISALTTKDPNKLKVYTDGFDGHCLRAFYYFGEQITGVEETPDSINSIADLYPDLRQDSKAPTFALTYQGTWITLVKNCGFSPEKAKTIEHRYHEMYKVSDQWVQDQLKQAHTDGYVTVAFGMRVRTPMLHKTIYGSKSMPYEAQAEARTAGNALGQSYGMLNNRAAIEFQERTLASKHRLDVMPCAHIHDAQYILIRDNIDVVHWVNINLIECMQWQDLPEIRHPDVKLGGELDLFYPTWEKGITLPNQATKQQIADICQEYLNDH